MTASICYAPVMPVASESLPTATPSWLIGKLKLAFETDMPMVLSIEHLDILVGMGAMLNEQEPPERNPFRVLAAAIRTHGAVKVWVEH